MLGGITIKYEDITLGQAEEYYNNGYIVFCDGDGVIVKLVKI